MRILIVDFAYQNINRTVMLWQIAWRQVGDATFFGPGHVSDEEWCAGLSAFIRRNGRFDVIVCAELVVSALSSELRRDVLVKAVENTYECPFDIGSAIDGCARNFAELLEADAVRILSMLEFDSYNMYASHRRRLDETDLYVVGWGEDFIQPKAALTDLERESFGGSANDRWHDFVTQNRARVISSPAMVAETEFHWSTLSSRADRWAVQGARYYARQEVRRRLREAGRPFVGRALVNLISIIHRIDPCILRWPSVRTMLNHRWEQGFRTSRYAFTCGSALRFPIRKYFEIPASGAVLAAQPCNGFAALGYRDGENAVVTEPETVLEVDARLRQDTEWAQKVSNAGRELVWDRHRVGARAGQYARAVEAIAGGCFHGSRWIDGEFVVVERPELESPAS
jgi:hypothetical protein